MRQGKNSVIAHIVLYSLSSLLVGCAVGGTLLFKVMTQDHPDGSAALPELTAAASDTTASTVETTTTAAPPLPNADAVRAIVQPGEALFTNTFYYTDSDRFEDHSEMFGRVVPFTSTAVVLTYSGQVTMTVNPNEIVYTLNHADKQIHVTLPEPAVVSHEIDRDTIRCYDVQNSLFSEPERNSYIIQLMKQKNAVLARVSENQQMPLRTVKQAERVIRSFLAVSETLSGYTVTFDEPAVQTETVLPETTTETTTTTTTTALPDLPDDDGGGWFFW